MRQGYELVTFRVMTPVLLALIALVLPLARLLAAHWPATGTPRIPAAPGFDLEVAGVAEVDHPPSA